MFNSIINLVHSGGAVMYPLVVCSFILWYTLVQRFILLKRGSKLKNRDLVLKMSNISTNTCFLTLVSKIIHNNKLLIQKKLIIEAQEKLGRYKNIITSIVTTAPLLGLLGTVIGMIETFDGLGNMNLYTQSGGIAGGISQALITTQMGLAVAIPGLILGRSMNKKQNKLLQDLDEIVLIQKAAL